VISASIISCINYKFCRVRVAGTGDAAKATAGITGKGPTPAARSQASAARRTLTPLWRCSLRGGIAIPGGVLGRG
jgi:hypothetical protein